MAGLKVLQSGLHTAVQDGGRHGYQRIGMPVAGAMDPAALYIANTLVGNDACAPALEATLAGPTLMLDTPCVFALAGADMGATLNGAPVEVNRAYAAAARSVLALGAAKQGCRGYIAFAGGVGGQFIMGSRSTYEKAHIGGMDGRRLLAGDELELPAPCAVLKNMPLRRAPRELLPPYSAAPTLRVTPGPQADSFSKLGLDILFGSEYTVTAQSDRMGCRLEGPAIEFAPGKGGNIISDAVAFGSVQIPSGKPIIMLADHQTTGGYAKPCCVIAADIPLAAQLKPGDKVRFSPISVYAAQQLYKQQRSKLEGFAATLASSFIFKHKPYWAQFGGAMQRIEVSEIKML